MVLEVMPRNSLTQRGDGKGDEDGEGGQREGEAGRERAREPVCLGRAGLHCQHHLPLADCIQKSGVGLQSAGVGVKLIQPLMDSHPKVQFHEGAHSLGASSLDDLSPDDRWPSRLRCLACCSTRASVL